jgi:tetratricopeptide (TPR) repeat protein
MDTREVITRFESERQSLALMSHANIAVVFDAGATESGRPYFVMELVAGDPITEFCEQHRLSVVERLRLFVQVCDGVQHAHQRGIIHRDIKSSNVLVALKDGRPEPKLIDFGIAKATGPGLVRTALQTARGQLVGTPAYMSPEQAGSGDRDVDTRTDVYSLGVVLYELLVGTRPHEPHGAPEASVDEMRRRIREDEPARPSDAVRLLDGLSGVAESLGANPASLRRQLLGDLDWILLKALEKDRDRRYGSPSELAADISRYLAHEPVLAGSPGVGYRIRKFVRRHRLGVAAAGLVAAALVTGTVLATWGLLRARRAGQEALREAEKAAAINVFLQKTLGSAHPSQGGRQTTVVETLGAASKRIDESFANQPEIRAAIQHTIGRTYADLGLHAEAQSLLERSFQTRRQVLGPEHVDVAESLNSLGVLAFEKGEYDVAETRFREALAIRRSRLGEESLPTVESLNDLAMTLQVRRGDYVGAEPMLQRVLAVRGKILGERHRDVAQSLNNLGMLYYRQEDLARAEPLLRQALALNQELLGKEHMEVASGLNNISLVLREKGEYAEAADLLRRTLAIYHKGLGARHPTVADALGNLGVVLTKSRQYGEAEKVIRESLEIQGSAYPQRHWRLAWTSGLLGDCLAASGRHREAEGLLTASHEAIRDHFGDDHLRTRAARKRLADLYDAWGKPEKALAYRPPSHEPGLQRASPAWLPAP